MMQRIALPLSALALLAGCAASPEPEAQLTPKQAERLAKLLDGKEPGKPESCVPASRASRLTAISDDVLVLPVNRHLVYRNDLNGTCRGLARGDILVLELHGSQYCRGDMARVVSPMSGFMGAVCSLGDFVPYRTPKKD